MTARDFIAKWRASTLKERSASQSHINDLCALVGHPTPVAVDPTGEASCPSRTVKRSWPSAP